eukprot:351015-Chlamydomonas_euryale.AAC.1
MRECTTSTPTDCACTSVCTCLRTAPSMHFCMRTQGCARAPCRRVLLRTHAPEGAIHAPLHAHPCSRGRHPRTPACAHMLPRAPSTHPCMHRGACTDPLPLTCCIATYFSPASFVSASRPSMRARHAVRLPLERVSALCTQHGGLGLGLGIGIGLGLRVDTWSLGLGSRLANILGDNLGSGCRWSARGRSVHGKRVNLQGHLVFAVGLPTS